MPKAKLTIEHEAQTDTWRVWARVTRGWFLDFWIYPAERGYAREADRNEAIKKAIENLKTEIQNKHTESTLIIELTED